jgi:hypothetical protein
VHRAKHKSLAVVVMLACALVFASCGESAQEKAKAQVCSARSDISKQVKMLGELTVSLSILSEAKTGVETIGKDLAKIKDAQPDLQPARREQIQAATHTFETQVKAILSELASKPSLSKAETDIKSTLTQLLAGYEKALAPVNC